MIYTIYDAAAHQQSTAYNMYYLYDPRCGSSLVINLSMDLIMVVSGVVAARQQSRAWHDRLPAIGSDRQDDRGCLPVVLRQLDDSCYSFPVGVTLSRHTRLGLHYMCPM